MAETKKRRLRRLEIHDALNTEFATVRALWDSDAETRRVDALLLSWVKYEKQLRRLFCFFIFQHPAIDRNKVEEVIGVLASERKLSPPTLIRGIAELKVKTIPNLLGDRYGDLWQKMERIRKIRNKLIHGQLTGQGVKSKELEGCVCTIVEWVGAVASAAKREHGYDGVTRRTFFHAKAAATIVVQNYPFDSPITLKAWLETL
jgi:hypothetical protein